MIAASSSSKRCPPGERGPALRKLGRDPEFGRTRLPDSSDPNDPRGLYAGQTQRRLLDDLSKLIDKDGQDPRRSPGPRRGRARARQPRRTHRQLGHETPASAPRRTPVTNPQRRRID